MPICIYIACLSVVAIALSAFNATLIFDDLYLAGSHFETIEHSFPGWGLVRYIGLNIDLAPYEYRLYGLSRLLHFGLWKCFGISPVPYVIWIAVTQILSGYGIAKLLLRAGADELQANAAWVVWVFSAFLVTSCFHHYSYLILPYQITVLCALFIRIRAISFLLGVAIALTGEAHLPAAFIILALAAWSSDRARIARVIDAAIPSAAIFGTIIAHWVLWKLSTAAVSGPHRFEVTAHGLSDIVERTGIWGKSIVTGMTSQTGDIISLSGGGMLLMLVGVILGAAVRSHSKGGSNKVVIGLLAVCAASFFVSWVLSVTTGLIAADLQRRYGYVPYTLCVMTLVVLLLAPRVKAAIGVAPAATVLAIAVSLWGMLQFVVLPSVRAQDNHVWNVVRQTLAAKGPGTSILFVSATNLDYLKRTDISVGSLPFRSPAPDIIESAFQGYWWESMYATVVAGAAFSAYRWEEVDDQNIKLFGNGLDKASPRIVAKSSVIVLYDGQRTPGDPQGVTTFTNWDQFKSVLITRP